jgi:hypothetical protein
MSVSTSGQNGFTGMDLGNDVTGASTSSTRIFTGSNNVRTGGFAKITALTSNSITVRLQGDITSSMDGAYRMGFRFYSPRLVPSTCSGITVTTSRWGAIGFSGYARSPGSIAASCGTGGSRKFFAIVNMYYLQGSTDWPKQWPPYHPNDYFDFTFTFSSVGGDVSFANALWISATWIW